MKRITIYLLLFSSLSLFTSAVEVQSHGLLFEKWLRDTFFGGYKPKGYTQKWDIPAEANPKHGNIPVNPKAAKHGTPIGLGDALRQFDISEPFLLIAGFWQQTTKTEKTWSNVQAARIEPAAWQKLWQPITRADLEHLDAVIKNKALSLEETRKQAHAIKSQPPFSLAVIQVNPKIDTSQRRLQCSLRFADFFTHLAPQSSPEPQQAPSVFGVPVPREFDSAPRQFQP